MDLDIDKLLDGTLELPESDDEYEGGGFEDVSGRFDEPEEPAGKDGDGKGDSEEPPKDPDDKEEPKEPKEPKEPEEDPQFELFRKLQEQNELLMGQVNNLTARLNGLVQGPPAKKAETPAENDTEVNLDDIDMPSEEEWVSNPTKAAIKVSSQLQAQAAKRLEQRIESKIERRSTMQSRQTEAWNSAVILCPDLDQEGSPIRATAGQLLSNPELGLKNNALGPFLAAAAAMVLNGYVPPQAEQEVVKTGQRQGAEAERQRQERLKSGVMNAGGKGGQATVTLSREHKRVAKQMGISEKAMLESIKAMGGGVEGE